jgi:hypothetical protein
MTGYVAWIDLFNTTQTCFARFSRLNQHPSHEPVPPSQRFLFDIEGCLPSGALFMHVSWTTAISGLLSREMTGNRPTLRHASPLYSRRAAAVITVSNEATRQLGNRATGQASLDNRTRYIYLPQRQHSSSADNFQLFPRMMASNVVSATELLLLCLTLLSLYVKIRFLSLEADTEPQKPRDMQTRC